MIVTGAAVFAAVPVAGGTASPAENNRPRIGVPGKTLKKPSETVIATICSGSPVPTSVIGLPPIKVIASTVRIRLAQSR